MRTHSRSLAVARIFAVLFVLLLAGHAVADPGTSAEANDAPVAVTPTDTTPATAEAPSSSDKTTGASCSTQAEKSYDSVTKLVNSWKVEASASCQYTCPQGMVMLCPEISGYTKSCVNNCCVYC